MIDTIPLAPNILLPKFAVPLCLETQMFNNSMLSENVESFDLLDGVTSGIAHLFAAAHRALGGELQVHGAQVQPNVQERLALLLRLRLLLRRAGACGTKRRT